MLIPFSDEILAHEKERWTELNLMRGAHVRIQYSPGAKGRDDKPPGMTGDGILKFPSYRSEHGMCAYIQFDNGPNFPMLVALWGYTLEVIE